MLTLIQWISEKVLTAFVYQAGAVYTTGGYMQYLDILLQAFCTPTWTWRTLKMMSTWTSLWAKRSSSTTLMWPCPTHLGSVVTTHVSYSASTQLESSEDEAFFGWSVACVLRLWAEVHEIVETLFFSISFWVCGIVHTQLTSGQWVLFLQSLELTRVGVSWGILCESELHCRGFWLLLRVLLYWY